MALEGLALLAIMTWYYPKRRRDGEVMGILMIGYSISRFLTEGLRADDDWTLLGFTLSQIISAILLTVGIATWIYILRQPKSLYANRAEAATSEVRVPHGAGLRSRSARAAVSHDRA